MEFGVFHEFPWREGQEEEAAAFARGFELVDAAERWGLDVLWLAELHFAPRSVLAAPLTIAGAIAGRTERLRIGTAVQVLPLGNPLRLAEEAATVDQISRGRLIFGVGRSGFPRSYNAYGIPYAESKDRFAEALQVITLAWTQPAFSFHGSYYHYDNVRLIPKPFQKPTPPIRVAATTEDTFPALGRQGHPLFAGVRLGTLSQLAPNLEAYREAHRAAGHPGKGEVFLRVPVHIAENVHQALSEPKQSILNYYRTLADQAAQVAADGGSVGAGRPERYEHLQSIAYEDVLREKVIVGTPEMVVDRLQALREELGLDGILAELNCGGQLPHESVMRSLRLLCEKVIPRVN